MEKSVRELYFQIEEEYNGIRIDKCISLLVDTLSRSYIQKLIKEQHVFVNDKIVKSSYVLYENDEIKIELPQLEVLNIEAQDIPLDILYEDDYVIVINKPKGMVVHPAAGHYKDTLVNALMYHLGDCLSGINGVMRPGIVHRIDMDTTGSIIVCKNDIAHNEIARQLKEHSIVRKYRAICFGVLKEDEGTINAPIGRHPIDRKKMAIVEKNGKNAITHYKVLERYNGYTYIECILETGRTHQIRVHMASIGHPLIGDTVYSNRKTPFKLYGQTLHAMTLGFVHPISKEYIEVNAPLPKYFEKILNIIN